MKTKIVLMSVILLVCLFPIIAQVHPPGGGAPIDGGLGILLALALGFGANKLYKIVKRNRKE